MHVDFVQASNDVQIAIILSGYITTLKPGVPGMYEVIFNTSVHVSLKKKIGRAHV